MVDFEVIKVGTENFTKLTSRLRYNPIIADFYRDLWEEEGCDNFDRSLLSNADRIESCSSSWDILWHRLQGFKGIVNLEDSNRRKAMDVRLSQLKAEEKALKRSKKEIKAKNKKSRKKVK